MSLTISYLIHKILRNVFYIMKYMDMFFLPSLIYNLIVVWLRQHGSYDTVNNSNTTETNLYVTADSPYLLPTSFVFCRGTFHRKD